MMRGKHPVSDAQLGILSRIQWELTRRVKEGTLPVDEVVRALREIVLQRKVDPDLYLARKALAQGLADEDYREGACSAYADLVGVIAESGDLKGARDAVAEISDGTYTAYWQGFAFVKIAVVSKAAEDFAAVEGCLQRFKEEEGDEELGDKMKVALIEAYAAVEDFETARSWAQKMHAEYGHPLDPSFDSCELDAIEAYAAIYAQSGERRDFEEGKRLADSASNLCDSQRKMAYAPLVCALLERLEIEEARKLIALFHLEDQVCVAVAEAFARIAQWDIALEWADRASRYWDWDGDESCRGIVQQLTQKYRWGDARSLVRRIKSPYLRALTLVEIADVSLQWGDLEEVYGIAEEMDIPWQQAEVYAALFLAKHKMRQRVSRKR